MALGFLHKKDVIHRDIKTENILIADDGYLFLTDFGLAKQLSSGSEEKGNICGSYEYVAPEILNGKEYGKPADWWSVGILTYELIVGLTPFFCPKINKMRNIGE